MIAPAVAAKANALGDFLLARRDQVRPQDVGLVSGGRRRAPGLRREELAMLAGISVEYYLRIERGRAQNPSPQVLGALARALKLDAPATHHLHYLANPTGSDCDELEIAAHALADVIDQFPMPAIVANRYQDVLAANPIARALSPEFTPGQNFLRWRLLDPAARELYVNWDEATASAVGGLRDLTGPCPKDHRMRALIAEMFATSTRFGELWGRGDVGYGLGLTHMLHPQVGKLYLYRNWLNAPYDGGQHVLMWRPEPGSDSARALEELAFLSVHQQSDLHAATSAFSRGTSARPRAGR
jgi:transcriptional regulator with XRE-family HTH domain